MGGRPRGTCTQASGYGTQGGVCAPGGYQGELAWNDWNVVAGDLENGMVELVTFTQVEACPSREW